ncbi:hypothetical protein FGRMN_11256 [Fusarium graminum]|nr:hypothetical protein FGRMN_11256 [Fusarium graminum]
MASYRPPRQQSRPYRYDEDLDGQDHVRPYESYDERDAPRPRRVRREPAMEAPSGSPPRRYKSERSRRPQSSSRSVYPEMADDRRPEHRSRPRRYEGERRGRSAGPDHHSRDLSPPPFGPPPDSPRRKARSARPDRDAYRPGRENRASSREPRQGWEHDIPIRSKRGSRLDRDHRSDREGSAPNPYDREPYARGTPIRPDQDEAREQRRPKTWGTNPDSSRRSGRSVPASPQPRSRGQGGRAQYADSDSDSENDHYTAGAAGAGAAGAAAAAGRRRQRSQTRDRRERPSGRSPTRGRPPTTQKGRGAQPGRRNSMPASTKARAAAWWQNPLVQAGARTAFTAGAQAAMKSGHESGPWLGPKGAKVATAALGAALVDGFMGQKHPDSTRQKLMRQGVDLASAQTTKIPEHRPRSRSRHGRR